MEKVIPSIRKTDGSYTMPAAYSKPHVPGLPRLNCGITDSQAWQMLLDAAQRVAAQNPSSWCPTIIHYARFEHPFLCRLHRENAAVAGSLCATGSWATST
jgi:DNA polymerase III subunit epsilon